MKSNYLFYILTILLFSGCSSSETPPDAMTQLEQTFHQQRDKESGQALVNAYETKLDTMSGDAAAKIELTGKMATVYFHMGANEGLQENFAKILNQYPNQATAVTTAQGILDTLLHSITDPETQRLVPNVAKQYIALTEIYAKARPDAPESPEQLYKAGEIARSISDFQKALSIYSTIENYFPQYEKAPKALFMQAFTYAEDLGDAEKARELYEAFIAKYPEDDFVDDAQILLETLGKSDEEIFQQLENQ